MTARQLAERDIRESLKRDGKKFIPMKVRTSWCVSLWTLRNPELDSETAEIVNKTIKIKKHENCQSMY